MIELQSYQSVARHPRLELVRNRSIFDPQCIHTDQLEGEGISGDCPAGAEPVSGL
jgi:hypothetical protein